MKQNISTRIPPYLHRVSARAKRVRLVITPETGLTVVTPPGFDPARLPDIVMERMEWVEHHLERTLEARRTALEPPCSLDLRAVGRLLTVRYRVGSFSPGKAGRNPAAAARRNAVPASTDDRGWTRGAAQPPDRLPGSGETSGNDTGGVRVRSQGLSTLEVAGNIACRDSVAQALRRWLVREGQRVLPPWLASEARRLGLAYSGVSVRLQRTRWGSCTAKGLISLNARLLFMPPEVVGYVLAHELAHTVHLNHSAAYWRFLEGLVPEARALDRTLRDVRLLVPAWARG